MTWETKLYVNPIAFQAIENKDSEFPIGSIIVLEKFTNEDSVKMVRVAYRIGGGTMKPKVGSPLTIRPTE